MRKVRVRFAPSPTGALHIGGIRTALYNYLFAKKHGGDFILRIEDTDTARTVPGAEEYIINALKWCGIEPTEGVGNPLYKQSNRNKSFGIYTEHIKKLVDDGNAYYAFDTPEEIEAMKNLMKSSGIKTPFAYGVFTRDKMKNSLVLSKDEVKERIDRGDPFVIRMKMPKDVDIKFIDAVRGNMSVKSHTIDDKVLMKSDLMPTYHLANVVDDHLMDISHVIRGEEWLPSAPLHVYMYECFGWKESMPEFVHLPLIMGPNGKLSKRDGDKYGFPVYPLKHTDPTTGEVSSGYKENGYLPEAVLNIVALLGWNPGGNVEMITLEEMVDKFSFEKINKSGAKFDLKKAEWFNHQYMLKTDNLKLAEMWLKDFHFPFWVYNMVTKEYVAQVCGLLKEKETNITKFWMTGMFFFIAPPKDTIPNFKDYVGDMEGFIGNIGGWLLNMNVVNVPVTHDNIKDAFNYAVTSSGVDAREAGKFLRLVITGSKAGPPMFDIIPLLGTTTSYKRIENCLNYQSNF